jgi:hypothetical protein
MVMVSPRAAVAMEAVCTCFESDVLGLMLLGSFDFQVSSLMSPCAEAGSVR